MITPTIRHFAVILHYPVKGSVLLWPGYYEGNEDKINKNLVEVTDQELPEEVGFYAFLKNNPYKVFVKKSKSKK